jgi:HEAT repeat protein
MELVLALSSPNMAERWQAVMALGETRDPAVAEFLLPSLRDEDIFVRLVTARVLSELGSPLAIPALIDALDDGESAVREAAYAALRTLTQRDLPFDHKEEDKAERARRIKAWRDWWEKEKDRYLEG